MRMEFGFVHIIARIRYRRAAKIQRIAVSIHHYFYDIRINHAGFIVNGVARGRHHRVLAIG